MSYSKVKTISSCLWTCRGCITFHHQQFGRALGSFSPPPATAFFKCRTVRHPISPVPEWTKIPLPEPVWFRNKGTQSCTGRYRMPECRCRRHRPQCRWTAMLMSFCFLHSKQLHSNHGIWFVITRIDRLYRLIAWFFMIWQADRVSTILSLTPMRYQGYAVCMSVQTK